MELQGKCVDLASAYKQLAVAPADAGVSVIAVWSPRRGCRELSRPGRCRPELQRRPPDSPGARQPLSTSLPRNTSSNFDDFSVLSPRALTESTDIVIKEFFWLIGWPIKESKDKPFGVSFRALGVVFDFEGADAFGAIRCGITAERVVELRSVLGKILACDALTAPMAGHVAGRLGFARSQAFGRCGGVASSHIFRRAREHGAQRLGGRLRWPRRWWLRFFDSAGPRVFKVGRQ